MKLPKKLLSWSLMMGVGISIWNYDKIEKLLFPSDFTVYGKSYDYRPEVGNKLEEIAFGLSDQEENEKHNIRIPSDNYLLKLIFPHSVFNDRYYAEITGKYQGGFTKKEPQLIIGYRLTDKNEPMYRMFQTGFKVQSLSKGKIYEQKIEGELTGVYDFDHDGLNELLITRSNALISNQGNVFEDLIIFKWNGFEFFKVFHERIFNSDVLAGDNGKARYDFKFKDLNLDGLDELVLINVKTKDDRYVFEFLGNSFKSIPE